MGRLMKTLSDRLGSFFAGRLLMRTAGLRSSRSRTEGLRSKQSSPPRTASTTQNEPQRLDRHAQKDGLAKTKTTSYANHNVADAIAHEYNSGTPRTSSLGRRFSRFLLNYPEETRHSCSAKQHLQRCRDTNLKMFYSLWFWRSQTT